jgi:hypothetical protein
MYSSQIATEGSNHPGGRDLGNPARSSRKPKPRGKYVLPVATRGMQLDYAMGFEEIGRRIGSNKKAVFQAYIRAMQKLSAMPEAFDVIRELIAERNKVRDSRTYGLLSVED